ncbi:dihydroxyacetone kinase phosphoryl donor subunit DhaM [Ruania zhangjianzhongii]|uniref:dihydroxyacetone kinase phosphoryl donor subunit DhaM n=1 Tax=Ruania zhangjianzhongii TaxID=2603206 RepID=UPI0011C84A0A|nr:dihydroxyacetone kinase phosphoryl donor subunit DhaM [Ruania zhangjianzhongii]
MSKPTAVLLVSHSAQLAAGVAEVAEQMAPDVLIRPAGGTEDGRIGTSYDLVDQAVTGLLDEGVDAVVLLTDLGSAALTAESVLELREDDRLQLADAPFVEGAVAAAVAAQGGGDAAVVRAAAEDAVSSFAGDGAARAGRQAHPGEVEAGEGAAGGGTAVGERSGAAGADEGTEAADEGGLECTLVLRNALGLHARPAAQLARKMSEFDAEVRVNGVDAASVLALMGLGLTGGAEIQVRASGPQAVEAMALLEADVEAGFGEE